MFQGLMQLEFKPTSMLLLGLFMVIVLGLLVYAAWPEWDREPDDEPESAIVNPYLARAQSRGRGQRTNSGKGGDDTSASLLAANASHPGYSGSLGSHGGHSDGGSCAGGTAGVARTVAAARGWRLRTRRGA